MEVHYYIFSYHSLDGGEIPYYERTVSECSVGKDPKFWAKEAIKKLGPGAFYSTTIDFPYWY